MAGLVERLESIGVKVVPYRRGPIGKHNFAIAVDGDRLRVWEGAGTITVSTNRRKQQAVLNVREPARVINTSFSLYMGWHADDEKFQKMTSEQLCKEAQWRIAGSGRPIREWLRLGIPGRIDIKMVSAKYVNQLRIQVKVHVRVRSTETAFLVGYDKDGTRPFVSQLKNIVTTVDEAHAELRPKGLPDNAKRQGEWFFVPASKKAIKRLNTNIHRVKHGPIDGKKLGWNSNATSHRGTTLYDLETKSRYALGLVVDNRVGRHEPLILNQWHRIVRNNEAVQRKNVRQWD